MSQKDLDETRRLMGVLVCMKPTPHEDMNVGKPSAARKPGRVSRGFFVF
jgi:hypothetical protein